MDSIKDRSLQITLHFLKALQKGGHFLLRREIRPVCWHQVSFAPGYQQRSIFIIGDFFGVISYQGMMWTLHLLLWPPSHEFLHSLPKRLKPHFFAGLAQRLPGRNVNVSLTFRECEPKEHLTFIIQSSQLGNHWRELISAPIEEPMLIVFGEVLQNPKSEGTAWNVVDEPHSIQNHLVKGKEDKGILTE